MFQDIVVVCLCTEILVQLAATMEREVHRLLTDAHVAESKPVVIRDRLDGHDHLKSSRSW